ncbi:MAG TPA: S1/P1 nuclease, partial [Allosphingosinicella sp.]|nr:S1/P1 nuclease [Allosphingosinicella sp.]
MRKLMLFAGAAATAVALGIVPLPSTPAGAWGPDGHHTVCAIAYRNLTHVAKAEVDRLIAADHHYPSFAAACTWADEVRTSLGRAGEHFANYPRSLASVTSPACPTAGPCVISAIDADLQTLHASGSDDRRAAALKWVGHWFGDIHQPLHISFADDKGGNSIQVSGACAGSHSNLHSTWDGCIIRERIFPHGGDPLANADAAAATLDAAVTPAQRSAWLGAQPWQWAAESYAIAIRPETLYCVQQAGTCRYSPTQATYTGGAERTQALTPAYLDRAAPIVRDRLSRAGIRLADALNRALDPNYQGPAVPPPGQTPPPPPGTTPPLLGAGPAAGPGDDLPNVPGAINPDVTQATIKSTICMTGWTKTIRPKVSYTNTLKRDLMARYKLSGSLSDYELDHLVSLEIGGHPSDP